MGYSSVERRAAAATAAVATAALFQLIDTNGKGEKFHNRIPAVAVAAASVVMCHYWDTFGVPISLKRQITTRESKRHSAGSGKHPESCPITMVLNEWIREAE